MKYGKLRAVIDKDGPFSGFKIKTAVAVAGVRGTDLYVNYSKGEVQAEVQVLRGEVEVVPTPAAAQRSSLPPKAIHVKSGEIARIEASKVSEVRVAAKEELARVQKESTVTKNSSEELAALSAPIKKEVEAAEKHAVENIVKDIHRYDPQAAQAMSDKKVSNVEDANTIVLYDIYKTAPAAPTKQKPNLKDLEERNDDVYQKYFKPLSL